MLAFIGGVEHSYVLHVKGEKSKDISSCECDDFLENNLFGNANGFEMDKFLMMNNDLIDIGFTYTEPEGIDMVSVMNDYANINQDIRFVITQMLNHEKEKRIIHCPRRAKVLLADINFNLERSVLGIPISKIHQDEHISETKINSNIVTIEKTPLLKPKPARSGTSSSTAIISSSETHRERFIFNQFEAPLDPWEAIQDDFHELKSVLK